ncbi:DNA-directed RNA polymerases II 24 kDa polypeptide (RNA polymerase II subunit 5) [Entomophthora muscae]|uniref:DNA-directed RNA polymerases II 24 kDa polypeptide (RNA polymerase II subunit 5) n=2 Tax=Entomophthora muscae TaxID=34485 RepID=A0ACC2SGR7_9FUNG|nr:DNA-directed RNA polymerases II 24 kDa polypeptide (RNA polymerase II subunit 5) [Entomophthora muscae]KAJ9077240.1 DNA-directed RNA polymerases II 24 kDa polypeptide (RNA polymerase II subunit 5) [Entomophthora muscae]
MSDTDGLKEISRFFRIYTNTKEMVMARRYTIVNHQNMDLDQFARTFASGGNISRDALTFEAQSENDPNDRLFTKFIDHNSVGTSFIKTIVEKLITENYSRCIIVTSKKLTSAAQKVIDKVAPKYVGEVFEENELQVNITRHVLVPQHVVLTADEKNILLARYHLKDTQLPRIQSRDPIARYYGLKRGEVVKIIRASETAGRYLTYRLCF